jgi:hypothetical protein
MTDDGRIVLEIIPVNCRWNIFSTITLHSSTVLGSPASHNKSQLIFRGAEVSQKRISGFLIVFHEKAERSIPFFFGTTRHINNNVVSNENIMSLVFIDREVSSSFKLLRDRN